MILGSYNSWEGKKRQCYTMCTSYLVNSWICGKWRFCLTLFEFYSDQTVFTTKRKIYVTDVMPFPIQNVLWWWNARKHYTVCGWEIYYACQSYFYAQDPKNPFLILLYMLLCCTDTTKSWLLYGTLWYTVSILLCVILIYHVITMQLYDQLR
jgi:hypothetical protein